MPHRHPLTTAKGERLFKHVTFEIVPPPEWKEHGLKIAPRVYRAEPHHGFTSAQIDQWLEKISESVEQQFSKWEFRLVQLGPNRFKFIYASDKPAPSGYPVMGKIPGPGGDQT